jgi:hypothetical protein
MQTPVFAAVFLERGSRLLVLPASLMLLPARGFGISGVLRVLAEVRRFDVAARRTRHPALQVFPLLAEQAGPL